MVKVKICGNRSLEDIKITRAADAQGFIVDTPKSPRNIGTRLAKELVRELSPFSHSVVVTKTTDPQRLEHIVGEILPDALQVHCELAQDQIEAIKKVLPPQLKIYTLLSIAGDRKEAVKKAREFTVTSIDALLLDTKVDSKVGGTGKIHDWTISQAVRDAVHPFPIVLAGGLNPENVGQAIQAVRPYGIDVATGVEEDGSKSRKKVNRLVREVKASEVK